MSESGANWRTLEHRQGQKLKLGAVVSPTLYAQVTTFAHDRGCSRADVIRFAIVRYLRGEVE